jgi:ribosomal protein L29
MNRFDKLSVENIISQEMEKDLKNLKKHLAHLKKQILKGRTYHGS